MKIEPLEHTTLTGLQIEVLKQNRDHFSNAIHQIGDAFDTIRGLDNKLSQRSQPNPDKLSLAYRLYAEGRKNFLSACTLATRSLDVRESVLSSFLAMELCVKGLLAEHNWDEEKTKALGHKPKLYTDALQKINLPMDFNRVDYVFRNSPDFVKTRYGNETVAEMDAVQFLIGVQFVSAELMRASGTRSFLSGIDEGFKRQWPPASTSR